MIEWQDEAIVLASRPHGETSSLVSLLTRTQGRHMGMVQGGQSRSKSSSLQQGQQVQATWRARLSDQLGQYTLEPCAPYPAGVLDDAMALAGLSSACAVADGALPEREAHPAVYEGFMALLALFSTPAWPYAYVKWEMGLLAELGYGINLASCAVTGQVDSPQSPLTHVSPRSGRAVCAEAAAPFVEKLLPLPGFLVGRAEVTPQALVDGLRLTGHFLEKTVFAVQNKGMPPARKRLIERSCVEAGY